MFFLFLSTLFITYRMVGINMILTNVLVFRLITKLGVRSECDTIQFAYHAGLFSPLDDVTAEHDSTF